MKLTYLFVFFFSLNVFAEVSIKLFEQRMESSLHDLTEEYPLRFLWFEQNPEEWHFLFNATKNCGDLGWKTVDVQRSPGKLVINLPSCLTNYNPIELTSKLQWKEFSIRKLFQWKFLKKVFKEDVYQVNIPEMGLEVQRTKTSFYLRRIPMEPGYIGFHIFCLLESATSNCEMQTHAGKFHYWSTRKTSQETQYMYDGSPVSENFLNNQVSGFLDAYFFGSFPYRMRITGDRLILSPDDS